MKVAIKELKKVLPKLSWKPDELASKLSIIGHEAEVLSDDFLDISFTSNRKDCHDIKYLAFDLVALYDQLSTNEDLIKYGKGKPVKVTLERVNKILGSNITEDQYRKIEKLGFVVGETTVTPPDFRVDIFEGADIAEEVFRVIGSDALKVKLLDKQPNKEKGDYELLNNLRAAMSTAGASETRTISFSRRGSLKLKNPFSTAQPYLRDTLLYGLLETVSKNPYLRRGFFYEIGNTITKKEITKLGVILTGYKKLDNITSLLQKSLGVNVLFKSVEQGLLDEFSVKQPNVVFAEIAINDIKLDSEIKYKNSGMPEYTRISKFPPLVRDISITSNDINEIKKAFDGLLICELIDTYTNPKTNTVNDTYRLIFQNTEKSFTQEEIKAIDSKISKFI